VVYRRFLTLMISKMPPEPTMPAARRLALMLVAVPLAGLAGGLTSSITAAGHD
jgi:hypothetical protein